MRNRKFEIIAAIVFFFFCLLLEAACIIRYLQAPKTEETFFVSIAENKEVLETHNCEILKIEEEDGIKILFINDYSGDAVVERVTALNDFNIAENKITKFIYKAEPKAGPILVMTLIFVVGTAVTIIEIRRPQWLGAPNESEKE